MIKLIDNSSQIFKSTLNSRFAHDYRAYVIMQGVLKNITSISIRSLKYA